MYNWFIFFFKALTAYLSAGFYWEGGGMIGMEHVYMYRARTRH